MEKLLSVCLITKDEESVLRRCLESIEGLADEIIVVDTGSTDSTKEIAREFTPHVYDFKWVNDFSVARNESLRYATSKWILVLDADEYINKENIQEYKLFLRDEDASSTCTYTISVVSYIGESLNKASLSTAPIPRLFPNFKGFKYYRPIHEQLTNEAGTEFFSKDSPITAFHTGYLKETLDSKNKSERNQKIFTALKQKSGFTPYDLYTIGNEHAVRGDTKKALYNYERAIGKATQNNPWLWHCAVHLANLYISLDRLTDALNIVEKVFKDQDKYPEPHYLLGHIYSQAGMIQQARLHHLQAIEAAEKLSKQQDVFWLINPSLGSTAPLQQLLRFAEMEQDTDKLIYYSIKLLQANPYDYKTLVLLLEVLAYHGSDDSVLDMVKKLYPEEKQRDQLILFKIFTTLGHKTLAKFYYEKLEDIELINTQDLLKYSLLQFDKDQFIILTHSLAKPIDQTNDLLLLFIGSLIFDLPDLTNDIAINSTLENQFECYTKLKQEIDLDANWLDRNSITLFDLLVELLVLQQFDLFDKFITLTNSDTVTNLIANYFYSHHMTDIAIDYFNVLLDRDQLSQASYVHFATLHFKQGLHEEGCALLLRGIELAPDIRHLYTMLLNHCKDDEIRELYKKKYFALSPQFSKLPVNGTF